MTRIGQNPAKFVKEVAKPARITVAVLNYIPFLSGFYAEMDGVLKACLNSIYQTKLDEDFDVLVFDNGSCDEIKQYLLKEQAEGRIQYLFLSEKNLGKGGAWNMIFDGAPGEIIAYTDNDCVFTPDWLEKSLRILETYPGQVLIVHGDQDEMVPLHYSERALKHFPDASLYVMKGAGHGFEGEDRETMKELALAFLQKVLL